MQVHLHSYQFLSSQYVTYQIQCNFEKKSILRNKLFFHFFYRSLLCNILFLMAIWMTVSYHTNRHINTLRSEDERIYGSTFHLRIRTKFAWMIWNMDKWTREATIKETKRQKEAWWTLNALHQKNKRIYFQFFWFIYFALAIEFSIMRDNDSIYWQIHMQQMHICLWLPGRIGLTMKTFATHTAACFQEQFESLLRKKKYI